MKSRQAGNPPLPAVAVAVLRVTAEVRVARAGAVGDRLRESGADACQLLDRGAEVE